MRRARFLISDLGAADILEQADWYQAQSGRPLVKRWEKAITSAILRIVRTPKTGTPWPLLVLLGTSKRKTYHYQRLLKASDLLSLP